MSQISLKSISGITSITTPDGVDNQLTLHNNNTSEAVKLDTAGNLHFHNHLNITGVSTASNFKTGTSNLHNTGLNVQDLDVDGHTNLDNVSIAGVTTFAGTVNYPVGAVANFFDDVNFKGPSGRDIVFDKSHAELHFSDDTTIIMGTNDDLFVTHDGTNPSILTKFGTLDIKTSQVAISTNMTVGGILTATTFKGDGSQLTGVGINTSQLDVNKLDVTGIATFKGGLNLIAPVGDYPSITAIDGNDKLVLRSNGLRINNQNGFRGLEYTGSSIHLYSGQMASHTLVLQTDAKGVKVGTGVTLETNGQATFSGIVTATSFSGDGSSLSNLPAGAPVGGASTNTVFFENDTAVAVNYQVTSGKNAMSAGPIAINAGIAVTVPSGSSWTIV